MEDFSLYIKRKRLFNGWTLKDVSGMTGISVSHLHYLENGKIERPKMEVLKALSLIYSVDEDELVIMAGRIPTDLYKKIVNNRELLEVIRRY